MAYQEHERDKIRWSRAAKERELARHLSLLACILIAGGRDEKESSHVAVEAYKKALSFIERERKPIRGVDFDND